MTELLWTGGFDSTFRICQLAREADADVQPYYLKMPRPGWEEEMKTIPLLWDLLQKHRKRRAVIRPVIYIEKADLPIPPDIEAAWQKFRDPPYELGGQYRRIAVFARSHKGVEIGQERYYKKLGHLRKLLLERGHMKLTKDQVGYFTPDDCDPAVWTLFGNLRLPICELHEPQMAKLIHKWGFEDVMEHVWFCYTPVNGKPCGLCVPCLTKHKNGMYKVLTPEAIQRANIYKRLEKDKRNEGLPEGKKLHRLFVQFFLALRDAGQPCDVNSIARVMSKPENYRLVERVRPPVNGEADTTREALEAHARGELLPVLDMYRRVLQASGFERKVLPEETQRLEEKIREIEGQIALHDMLFRNERTACAASRPKTVL